MKQREIGFRELLERLLPVEELPPVDRLRVQRALRSGVAQELERAALHALDLLEQQGSLRRLPVPGHEAFVRYQARNNLDVITLPLAAPRVRDGVVSHPRSALPTQAPARLDQVRRLIRLDDPLVFSDPRTDTTRAGLLAQLDQATHELLGTGRALYFGREGDEVPDADEPFDRSLTALALEDPQSLFYCADTERSGSLAPAARARGVRAVVAAAVTDTAGHAFGHLEVRASEPDPFQPAELAMIALLADYCGAVIERASRIEKLVFVDPLTGAYNRSYYDLQIRNEIERTKRESDSLALVIADIDDFKSFNSMFGYEAGNQVLVQVAQALRRTVRPFDTVARWGGEEFVVVLTAPVHEADAVAICERLRTAVETTSIRLEGLDGRSHRVNVTVSVGVAMCPDHAENAQDLWRAANAALLKAKRPPKNQVVFYRSKPDTLLGLG